MHFGLKHQRLRSWPVMVKIDISPLCNLSCTYCVHARPSGPVADILGAQSFTHEQLMPLAKYQRLVREISGKTMAVQLYYLGDPLIHPQLDEMCGYAREAGLNVHISSNFSFGLSDERLRALVASGLTHITVCVDGMRQESYARTRVGGRLDTVLHNLERLIMLRHATGQRYPRVEVQYIKYRHNLDQVEDAARWCAERGVDQFTEFWGNLHNYADAAPGTFAVRAPRMNQTLPQCTWPYFSIVVKYDGDAIPCCYYRTTEQYRAGADERVAGNVFETSLWKVWNSPVYQDMRRLVSNPQRTLSEARLAHAFCQGCPAIFETDLDERLRTADKHAWEELYVLDARQHVVRR
jgi:MoaA/NifB/PqqE/SkfB family radical SAM enzyme